jgi:D-glycero-D-manno-heptose 1,7-bisphosphate phosphatase
MKKPTGNWLPAVSLSLTVHKKMNQLSAMAFDLKQITKDWTLFLDRDGVINHEKDDDYIHTWEEFRFYPGVLEAIRIFTERFHRIIVVTNQRGVGKGVTKQEDLERIHDNMVDEVKKAGGRIDAVYYCPDIDDSSYHRKPNPGMGLQALKDFPDIDPARALMIGNTLSDMHFGRNLGMHTIFLTTTRPEVDLADERIDAVYDSLLSVAAGL